MWKLYGEGVTKKTGAIGLGNIKLEVEVVCLAARMIKAACNLKITNHAMLQCTLKVISSIRALPGVNSPSDQS